MIDAAVDIWNRACGYEVEVTRPGDVALRRMLGFHGLVENGGLLHATEFEADDDEDNPLSVPAAYRFFDLEDIAALVERAAVEYVQALQDGEDALEQAELRLDNEYVWIDNELSDAFEAKLKRSPESFEPLGE